MRLAGLALRTLARVAVAAQSGFDVWFGVSFAQDMAAWDALAAQLVRVWRTYRHDSLLDGCEPFCTWGGHIWARL